MVAAGGTVPDVLGHLLSGTGLIEGLSAAPAPVIGIVEELAAGRMTSQRLSKVIEAAAQQQAVANCAGDLKRAMEPQIVQRFHAALRDGAADEIISSLESAFDAAAEAIAHAKSVIGSGESTLEHVLDTGTSETVEAWQQLPRHLATVTAVAGIASMFGCRQGAQFSLIESYTPAYNHRIDDRAVMVTSGGLVADSALMMQPDHGRTSSPFYRAGGLRLHTIAEAQARYDEFAASEHDRIHGGPRGGHIGEDGRVHEDPVPINPFRQQEVSTS